MPGELSRADGPSLVWRQLQHQTTPEYGRGNPLVHGWAVVVSWIRTLLTSPKLARRQSAKWRLLYLNVTVDLRDPSDELQQSALDFMTWRGRLHLLPLDDVGVVKQLYVQAFGLARKAADQAARAAARNFSKWLQEGPSAGLKRQHQLSRTAVGWIPTAIAATEADEHETELEEADLPAVAEAARVQRSLQATLSMQQSAEAER